jgi:hypothetical protein
MEEIRLILVYVCSKKIKVYHMDVKSAFLNGELEEEVYIEQKEGFQCQKGNIMFAGLRKHCMVSSKPPEHGTQGWTSIYNNKVLGKEMQTTIST